METTWPTPRDGTGWGTKELNALRELLKAHDPVPDRLIADHALAHGRRFLTVRGRLRRLRPATHVSPATGRR